MGRGVDEFITKAKTARSRRLRAKFHNLAPEFLPVGWSYDDWFNFEERAAILEFDGDKSREDAECDALIELGLELNGERQ